VANRLKMAKIQAIQTLHEQGWRNRRIARELHVDRETVAKYVRAATCVPKPATAPLGSAEAAGEGSEGRESPGMSGASTEPERNGADSGPFRARGGWPYVRSGSSTAE
jgi:hypothetical protein